MKRLPLHFRKPLEMEEIQSLLNVQRNFQKMVIDFIRPKTIEDITHILKHGADVRELRIEDCKFKHPMYLQSILESMPLLEKIHINGVHIQSDIEITPIHLKNLVKLEIIESNLKVVNFFTGAESKINHFSLNLDRENPSENLLPVWKFLSMQTKLQEFSSLGNGFVYDNASTIEEFGKVQYRLKKLSFRGTIKHRMLDLFYPKKSNDNNLLDFLKTQTKSVEEISLYRTFSAPIYKFILMNFQNLKTIHFLIDGIPVEDITRIFDCKPIRSVKELIIAGNLNLDACKAIFGVFPDVEKLVVDNSAPFDNDIMVLMTTMLLKVDSLHLNKVDDSMFRKCTFGALKTLQMHQIKNLTHNGLTRMTKCNPSIESLSIKLMEPEFNQIFDIIARNLKNLKVLKLGRGFYPTEKVAKDINKHLHNLRVFKIADYFAKDNETICYTMKNDSICVKKTECNTCHDYTNSKYPYTEADKFDISSHIDHSKIMFVSFNLSKLSFTSEFAIDNILENGNYHDEIKEHSNDNLMNDTEWIWHDIHHRE